MAEGGSHNRSDSEDLLQTPYVRVATREIALLVQEIQKAQIEKKKITEKCQSLEHYIFVMGRSELPNTPQQFFNSVPSAMNLLSKDEDTYNVHKSDWNLPEPESNVHKPDSNVQQIETKLADATYQSTHDLLLEEHDATNQSTHEMLLEEHDATNQSTHDLLLEEHLIDNELEVDCDSSLSVVEHPPDNDVFKTPPNIRGNELMFRFLSNPDASLNDIKSQTRLPLSSNLAESTTSNDHVGVSKHYFDLALNELAKSKRMNFELLKDSEKELSTSEHIQKLQNNLYEVEKQKSQLQINLEELHKGVQNQIAEKAEVVSMLQNKLHQQERQSSLRNLAFDHLNKQCDKWRGKYEEISEQREKLLKNIFYTSNMNPPAMAENNVVHYFDPNMSTVPNFCQLDEDDKTDDNDIVNSSVTAWKKSNGQERDSVSVSKNDNDSYKSRGVTVLPTLGLTHTEVQDTILQRKEASTQSEKLTVQNKLVQTEDLINNNIIIDEETQTDAIKDECNLTRDSEELINDLTIQNDILNRQYESMRSENNRLASLLSTMEESSVAHQMAERMKQLNLQLFSVYREKADLQKLVERPSTSIHTFNANQDTGFYSTSLPSTATEKELKKTLKLGSRDHTCDQSVLSDLILDCDNLHRKYESIQNEVRSQSCPVITK